MSVAIFQNSAYYLKPISGFLLAVHSIMAMFFALHIFAAGYEDLTNWIVGYLIAGLPWLAGFLFFSKKYYLVTSVIAVLFIGYASYIGYVTWNEGRERAPPPLNCGEGEDHGLCHMYNHL